MFSAAMENALYSEWVGLREIFVVWTLEMTWKVAMSVRTAV
jgi:hypothetical protein